MTSGFFTSSVNIGKLTNKGVEVLLTGTLVKAAVTWDVSLNFAMNNGKVVSLLPGQDELLVEYARTFSLPSNIWQVILME